MYAHRKCALWACQIYHSLKCWTSLVAQTVKNLCAMWEMEVQPLGQEDFLEKKIATHSRILAGEFHGQKSLVGYSPWGRKELDMNEWLTHTHTHTHIQSWGNCSGGSSSVGWFWLPLPSLPPPAWISSCFTWELPHPARRNTEHSRVAAANLY